MSDNSLIEWCTATWNFLIGCTKKSAGCMHCYAIRQAWRMMHNPNPKIAKKFEGTVHKDSKGELNWTGRINFDDEVILKPLSWRLPRRVFVNSLSDLFHKNVKDEWLDQAFAVMALCPQHTFQILTKEPERMLAYMTRLSRSIAPLESAARQMGHTLKFKGLNGKEYGLLPWPIPNVWLGTSVEDQKTADERIPLLMETPAAIRWVSAEPLLGPIDFEAVPTMEGSIDWVVVGGESGPKARPMHPDWARSLRDQCVAAGVPFFFKQWGSFLPIGEVKDGDELINGTCVFNQAGERISPDCCSNDYEVEPEEVAVRFKPMNKKAAGRLLDGREWNEFPKTKAVAAA